MSRHSKKGAPKTSRPTLGQGSLPGLSPPQKEREEAAKKAPATKRRGRQTSLALDLSPSPPAPSRELPQEKLQDRRQDELLIPIKSRPQHEQQTRLQTRIQTPEQTLHQEHLETEEQIQDQEKNRLRVHFDAHFDDHFEAQEVRFGTQSKGYSRHSGTQPQKQPQKQSEPLLSPPLPAANTRLPWERYLDSEEEGDEPQSKQEALRRSMQKLLGRAQPRGVNRVQDLDRDQDWDQDWDRNQEQSRVQTRAQLREQNREPASQDETRRQPKLAHLPALLRASDFRESSESGEKSDSPGEKRRKPSFGLGRFSEAELLGSDLELGLLRLLHSERRAARLTPSRRILLISQVSGMELREGALEAAVSDGLGRRYRIQLRLETFSAAQWARVARSVSTRPTLLAQLRDAHLSWQLCVLAPAEGLDLLPPKLGDLRHACTCGQRNGRCQHFFALCLAFAQHLAENPSAILVLRGANPAELVSLVERVAPESAKVGGLGESESDSEDGASGALGTSDPFAAPNAPLADWSLLDSSPSAPPLGAPEFWRHPAQFKEMSERLIHLAMQNFPAKSLLTPDPGSQTPDP